MTHGKGRVDHDVPISPPVPASCGANDLLPWAMMTLTYILNDFQKYLIRLVDALQKLSGTKREDNAPNAKFLAQGWQSPSLVLEMTPSKSSKVKWKGQPKAHTDDKDNIS